MRNKIYATLLLVLTFYVGNTQINAPQASPFATVTQKIGLTDAKIEYSRPSLKGRKMIGSALVPFGSVWRTGANGIPKITLAHDVTIGGKEVPAGTYGLITIPNLKTWTIILTKNANQWGTYDYKQEEDLVRFDAKFEALTKKAENFTIGFTDLKEESASIYIKWELTSVKFPIKHDAHTLVMKEIDEKMKASEITTSTYFGAADYYFSKGEQLDKALEWANKVVEGDQKYWTYYLRGKIAAKLGKCDVALEDAKKGLAMAKAENDPAYVKNHQSVIRQCTPKTAAK
ncbi:MAG TPA: DUF2911 domain-containing protein [Saprospiraceae bacterium]|nr:DUF2911 domain-containing protein [Saprospiraceae bacterium]